MDADKETWLYLEKNGQYLRKNQPKRDHGIPYDPATHKQNHDDDIEYEDDITQLTVNLQ